MSPLAIPIAFFVMTAFAVVGYPLARAFARRIEGGARNNALPPGVDDRLQRMENAIDSIAIEVERISEGQRFTTRLLSEQTRVDPSLRSG